MATQIARRQTQPRYIPQGKDGLEMSKADRQYAYDQGNELMDLSDDVTQAGANDMERYGNAGDDVFLSDFYGNGGLTTQQQSDLEKNNETLDAAAQFTEDEYKGNFYNDWQKEQIMGDPYEGQEFFQPEQERGRADASAGRMRGATDSMESEMEGAYDPEALKSSGGFQEKMSKLPGSYAKSIDAATNTPELGLSDGFADSYRMSDEDQQNLVTQAGRAVGARYQTDTEEAARKAAAAGINPIGISALTARAQREAAANGADAITSARIAANREAAGREKDIEQMRLDAAGNQSGMKLQGAAMKGDMEMSAATAGEDRRVAGEESVASKNLDTARTVGQTRVGQESEIADRDYAQTQDIRNTGVANGRYADQQRSQRAQTVGEADVRGNVNASNTRSDRLMDRYNALQSQTGTKINAQREDKQAGGQYVQNRINTGADMTTGGLNSKINAYNSTTGAANAATGQQNNAQQIKNNKRGVFDKIISGVGAASGMASAATGGKGF